MPSPIANGYGIAQALQTMLAAATLPSSGTTFFENVYIGMPQTFAASPVAVIRFISIAPSRFTAGAGRNKDAWVFGVDCYVDRLQTTYTDGEVLLYGCIDTVRTTIHAHIRAGVGSSTTSILVEHLDGLTSMGTYQMNEGKLYSVFSGRLTVVEEYTTAIGD